MNAIQSFFQDKSRRTYPKGQILLYQAEETNDVFYIESGYVKVYDVTSSGEERLLLIQGPGDIFPVIWTFRESDSLLYFYESMTEINVKVSKRRELLNHIDSSHDFSKALLKHFVARIKELFLRVECVEASNARYKVIQVLDYLLNSHPGKVSRGFTDIPIPLTHQTIANMAGLSRETASISLKDLQDKRIIKPDNSGYAINGERLTKEREEE